MTAKDYLQLISNEIHTTIVATVDDKGLPVTAAIDMMMSDERGLYFLTARGKSFSASIPSCRAAKMKRPPSGLVTQVKASISSIPLSIVSSWLL